MKTIAVGLTLGLAATPAAAAGRVPIQTLSVVNAAHVPAGTLQRVERAVQYQANAQLRPWWGTPKIRFGSGGWTVTLRSYDATIYCCGAHDLDPSGLPRALVLTSAARVYAGTNWSETFSHEVLEMIVDPYGTRPEVCDDVGASDYRVRGVWVSDFMLPAWFKPRHHGRLDWLDEILPNGLSR